MKLDLSSIINLTEASAEKVIVVSLLVIMIAYVGNVLITARKQGIVLTGDDSGIEPTSLPSVPEEVAETVEAERAIYQLWFVAHNINHQNLSLSKKTPAVTFQRLLICAV
eukprot:scaffold652335_cov37-Prasinocladus_malaysianus.AAC.1